MPFITTAQYPAVRAALSVTLTEAKLPDSVIASAVFHPAAEAEVTRRLGDAATAAAGNEAAARAVILLTAARLAPSLPNILRQDLGDVSIQYGKIDIPALVRSLRDDALGEISTLLVALGYSEPVLIPGLFTVASGNRTYRTAPEAVHLGGLGE